MPRTISTVRDQIVRFYENGCPILRCSKEIGVSPGTVRRTLIAAGVGLRLTKGRILINLTGKRFRRFLVLGYAGNSNWHCLCECGSYRLVQGGELTGRTSRRKSCGCYAREISTTHGHTKGGRGRLVSPEYTAYQGAKERCTNPNNRAYADYGGRGIKFRFNSFEEFLAEAGPKPSPAYSIDRIDNDGHYEKGNIRWATRIEQNNNQRRHKNWK